ncbi:MAG: 50S ribosomal protein L10 [Patescibacteria group bacterium]|mgnify:FL=1
MSWLTDRFRRQKIAIFSDLRGVSVTKAQILRRALKNTDAEYKVAKKTLFDRALDSAGFAVKTKEMQGEIGVAFGYGDQAAPARILAKFGKENDTFKILGGLLGSRVMTEKDITALARLPSREVLLAQVVGALSAPMRGLVGALQASIRNLTYVIGQLRDNKSQ